MLGFYLAKIRSKLVSPKKRNAVMNQYFRKRGIKVGQNVLICSNIGREEPQLIEIGDNTTISSNVSLITHDFSVKHVSPEMNNIFGRISIGRNCFIGANSTILYGVSLGDDIIVAAGSVVTHSFYESRIIIGGNPAKKIGTWDSFYNKVKDKNMFTKDLAAAISENPDKLVTRSC